MVNEGTKKLLFGIKKIADRLVQQPYLSFGVYLVFFVGESNGLFLSDENCDRKSIGTGNMMVEFFSTAIELSV